MEGGREMEGGWRERWKDGKMEGWKDGGIIIRGSGLLAHCLLPFFVYLVLI